MKRAFDLSVALVGLAIASPFLAAIAVAIWLQDFASPFYVPLRMARGGGDFRMVKFRTMVINADKSGVNSTAGNDRRITPIGRFVRAYKVDEVVQLWNVLKGDMSLVGPRPQVKADADLYTSEEMRLLSVRPGITDPASIVFADEGEILKGSDDPDLLYNQIIRPWKSRLSLLYIDQSNFRVDLRLITLTAMGMVARGAALNGVQRILRDWGADELLGRMARREEPLLPYPPPGASKIVRCLAPELLTQH
jgi:lipopolysaccharide/colanic/teichoic acid biosynthesis glycosyltransferase